MITKLNCKVILDYMQKNNISADDFCKKCKITKENFNLLMTRFSPQDIDTLINIYVGTNINILKMIEERP